ncbi:MAG: fumarylacetoacetate hydrolase family protein [Anaerolineae bacterium]|nr:fumarylacetoacetate hydrolase family protein [Anaerolineae bacterium]
MYLTRHQTESGPRWAMDGQWISPHFTLAMLLDLPQQAHADILHTIASSEKATGALLPPIDPLHEVWASGVTYLRSRDARQAESETGDIYARVYNAERPELFFKALGWRVIGPGAPIRIRADSHWNVPEPELTLVINQYMDIVGYCAGNDVSSRDIEGVNPLYLPQAKVYDGSCALGPGIQLVAAAGLRALPVQLEIAREKATLFTGETSTTQMKRELEDLVAYLGRELTFPQGCFLMTGTGIVPPDNFTLQPGDIVRVTVGELTLENEVGVS